MTDLFGYIKQLGYPIRESQPVHGGDINHAAMLLLEDGRRIFVKYNRQPQAAAMLRAEKLGLALLGASRVIATPKIFAQGEAPGGWAFLLLEYIAPGVKKRPFWQQFGASLATLHGSTSAQFGFAHDNFIGSLPQANGRLDTWAEFYAERRLHPQLKLARNAGLLDSHDARLLEKCCARIGSICPAEAPALIHGDLWSGNFLCSQQGSPVLIDPAACYAHREMDLAMSQLFGGFDDAFYEAYNEAWPLEPGFAKRQDFYHLYYLLVHVNLFGAGYVDAVRQILKAYA